MFDESRAVVTTGPKKRRKKIIPKRRMPSGQLERFETNRAVRIQLATEHNINGVWYGPGQVMVSRVLAGVLQENDRRAVEAETIFHSKRAFVVGAGKNGYKPRAVAPESFEAAVNTAEPALTDPR